MKLTDYIVATDASSNSTWDVDSMESQLTSLLQEKLGPLRDDFSFDDFHANIFGRLGDSNSAITITFVCDGSESSRNVLRDICGSADFLSSGKSIIIVKHDKSTETGGGCMGRSGDEIEYVTSSLGVRALSRLNFAIARLDALDEAILRESQIVFYLLDLESDIESDKRYTEKLKLFRHPKYSSLLRMVITGAVKDVSHVHRRLPHIMWVLCQTVQSIEMPEIYFYSTTEEETNIPLFQSLSKARKLSLLSRLITADRATRAVRAHALILSYVKSQLPVFNKQARQFKLVTELDGLVEEIANVNGVPVGDLLSLVSAEYRSKLENYDFTKIKKLKQTNLNLVNELLGRDIPRLIKSVPHSPEDSTLCGGWVVANLESDSKKILKAIRDSSIPSINLFISSALYLDQFKALGPDPATGTLSGNRADVKEFLRTVGASLPSGSLYRLWKLADTDKDGALTLREFAIILELIKYVKLGNEVPNSFDLVK